MIRFADLYGLLLEIKIRRAEGKQLAGTDTCPVQHFKCIVGAWLIHHHFRKFQIFFLRPELHFLARLYFHATCTLRRIIGQIVKIDRMVEDCCKLCMNRFQIITGIWFSLLIPVFHQLILPCDYILCFNVCNLAFAEVGKNFLLYHMALGFPCAFLQPCLFILCIDFIEARKCHIQLGILL